MKIKNNWFTIVELLVAIVIFTLWLLSAFLLIYSAMNISHRSQNEIIIANLAREKFELIRNIRDTNWMNYKSWNKLDNLNDWAGKIFGTGFYKIENDFKADIDSSTNIKLSSLSSSFDEDNNKITKPSNPDDSVRFCIDNKWIYTYDCSGTSQKTSIYWYLEVKPLILQWTWTNKIQVNNWIKVTAKFLDTYKWNKNYSISTIITDWKRD